MKINFKGVAIGDGLCDPEMVSGQKIDVLKTCVSLNVCVCESERTIFIFISLTFHVSVSKRFEYVQ